jgi:hypothetical protein
MHKGIKEINDKTNKINDKKSALKTCSYRLFYYFLSDISEEDIKLA